MRASEFFEAEDGRLSMTRLIVFLTWVPATIVLLSDSDQLTTYLSFYVGGYAIGKGIDAFVAPKQSKTSVNSSDTVSNSGGVVVAQSVGK